MRIRAASYSAAKEEPWLSLDPGIRVFLGNNGGGKSRLLRSICEVAAAEGRPTIAIANTPYGRFDSISSRVKRLPRSGKDLPERVIKRAIMEASAKTDFRLARLSSVLRYCGYDPAIGFRVIAHAPKKPFRAGFELEKLPYAAGVQVENLISWQHSQDTFWADFEGPSSDRRLDMVPKFVQWEKELKGAGYLDSIRIYLRRRGDVVALGDASSGELTLISSMMFIAGVIDHNAVLLVDEPENSLHPIWQRQYLDLLAQYVGDFRVNVFVATHSPLIVSSLNYASWGFLRDLEVVRLTSDATLQDSPSPESLEGILLEAFGTVSPANHYLSILLTNLLDSIASDPAALPLVMQEISKLENATIDSRQRSLLVGVREMAVRIAASPRDYRE